MTATVERPQTPETRLHVRHRPSWWIVALVAALGLIAGAAIGYWWSDYDDGATEAVLRDGAESIEIEEATPNTVDQNAEGLSEREQQALAILDEWTAALNTGDMDLVNSFYADDPELGWIVVNGAEVPVDRNEYFQYIPDTLARDYEFVSAGYPHIESGMAVFVVQVLKLTPDDGNNPKLMVIGRHMSATKIVQEWLLWESPPL